MFDLDPPIREKVSLPLEPNIRQVECWIDRQLGKIHMKGIFVVSIGLAAPILALAFPAMAGPREDTLAGISLCAGNRDDRTYLDCIYGAVQPLRASLGLPPAPPNQLRLVPPIQPTISQSGAPPAQNFGAAATPALPSHRPTFLERMYTPKDYKPDAPTTLASYSFDAAGFFTVTLANGQHWKQDNDDSQRAIWNKRPQTYPAQIVLNAPRGSKLRVGSQIFMVSRN